MTYQMIVVIDRLIPFILSVIFALILCDELECENINELRVLTLLFIYSPNELLFPLFSHIYPSLYEQKVGERQER
jgi:hypothetical protein